MSAKYSARRERKRWIERDRNRERERGGAESNSLAKLWSTIWEFWRKFWSEAKLNAMQDVILSLCGESFNRSWYDLLHFLSLSLSLFPEYNLKKTMSNLSVASSPSSSTSTISSSYSSSSSSSSSSFKQRLDVSLDSYRKVLIGIRDTCVIIGDKSAGILQPKRVLPTTCCVKRGDRTEIGVERFGRDSGGVGPNSTTQFPNVTFQFGMRNHVRTNQLSQEQISCFHNDTGITNRRSRSIWSFDFIYN